MDHAPGPTPRLREFTLKAVACGIGFGAVFGAANAWLGLKAGLTVSTSIPIAVLSVAVFRIFRGGTVLEANMAQTIGSASSSLASGTIFTVPALFMWGFAPPFLQVAVLAFLGGILGILAMIPLRRLLIVKADAELPYPEGRACAEVIRATERGSAGGAWIFIGIGAGVLVKLVVTGFHLLPEQASVRLGFLPNATLSIAVAPALVAVGYIVGLRSASVMVSGSLITALVLYPIISMVPGRGAAAAGAPPFTLSAAAIKSSFITYIGAGAVAAAGLITIGRTLPTMARSFAAVVGGLRAGGSAAGAGRTDRDLPGVVLIVGLAAIALVVALVPGVLGGSMGIGGRMAGAAAVIVFGLVFVPVSSRLVGVIGVSSNPTSAMALITIAATATVFLAIGLGGGPLARAAVLTVGTIVCVAASKAGDISQDLKTGFLVGGTPALQQFGQLLAAATACFAVAGVVVAAAATQGFGEGGLGAPQATLMKTVIEAVLGANLPWDCVAAGASLGAVGALAGLPPLPFALGIYLPLSTMAAIFFGGVLRRMADGKDASKSAGAGTGVLCASGFVAGEGLAGVGIAALALASGRGRFTPPEPSSLEAALALAVLGLVGLLLLRSARAGRPR